MVLSQFELRPDELVLLEDACRTIDRIDELDEAQKETPLVARGSQGQPVISPLVSEARFQRGLLTSILRQLGISDVEDEDDESTGPMSRSASAKKAAEARWSRRRIS